MGLRKNNSNDVLRYAAKKHGLSLSYLDKPRNKVIQVSNKKTFFISNSFPAYIGIYPTNVRFTYDLFRDKAWTKKMLKRFKYKVTTGDYFYLHTKWASEDPSRNRSAAFAYAESIGYPIFVKPNSGSQGNYASIIYNKTQLKKHLRAMRHYAKIFLIEKMETAPEYRLFIVGGEIMFAYKRERMAIIGDGRSKIIELLDSLHILPTPFIQAHLKAQKMSLKSVLKQGSKFDILPVANISQGSKIQDYTEKFAPETSQWARELSDIFNTHVIGVDVFAPDGLAKPQLFKIIEINHQPSLVGIFEEGHKEKTVEIWGRIFRQFFDSK